MGRQWLGNLVSRSLRPASAVTEIVAMLADRSGIGSTTWKRSEPWRRRLRFCVAARTAGEIGAILGWIEAQIVGIAAGVDPETRNSRSFRYGSFGLSGYGDTQHPIPAIGRTGDSPARRIARLTMAKDAGSKRSRPTSRRICDIARDSATQPPTGEETV